MDGVWDSLGLDMKCHVHLCTFPCREAQSSHETGKGVGTQRSHRASVSYCFDVLFTLSGLLEGGGMELIRNACHKGLSVP